MLTIEKKAVRAGRFVDTKHVDTIIKNYKQHRWVHNSKRLGKEDSLSVWFSVEDIEAFLAKAKKHGGDGVRFYFGAYNEHLPEEPILGGRQTIVMVATRQKDALGGTTNKDIYYTTEQGSSILAFNFGQVCPPFCSNSSEGGVGVTIVDQGEDGLIVA